MDHLKTDELMRELARAINSRLMDVYGQMGFALLVFPFGAPGESNYISNANRQDMIKALREAADRLEKKQDIPPVYPGTH